MQKTMFALLAVSSFSLPACMPETQQLTRLPTFYAGREPLSVVNADLNGDGKMDLVVTRAWGKGEISILLGKGDGTFYAGGNIAASGSPKHANVADFNGDGKLDLAIPDLIEGGAVSILMGKGDGTFLEPMHHLLGRGASSVKSGDLNGDGKLDLIAVNVRPDSNSSSEIIASKITIMLGHGDGTFDAAMTMDLDNAPRAIALADFDGDGKLDVALADDFRHQVSVLKGRGDGSFNHGDTSHMHLDPIGLHAADLNKDGHPDLVVAVAGGVSIMLGNGKGGFSHLEDYYTEATRSGVVVDLDKDGNLDIVTARRVLHGDGTGHFSMTTLPHAVNDDSWIWFGDFNGDGWSDIVAADSYHNQLSVYLNRGGKPAMSASAKAPSL